MQSAAGGTSQRLKPAVAIVRSLSRSPAPAPDLVPALLLSVVINSLLPLQPPLPGRSATYDPAVPKHRGEPTPTLLLRTIPECAGITKRIREFQPPTRQDMPGAGARLDPKCACPGPRCMPCHGRNSTSAAPRRIWIGTERGTGVDRQKVGVNQSDYRTAGDALFDFLITPSAFSIKNT